MSKMEKGKRVKINCTAKLLDGTVIDSPLAQPFEFELEGQSILPELSHVVGSMAIGETKVLELPPEKAFGVYDKSLIVVLPKDSLPPNFQVKEGQYVIYENGEHALKRAKVDMIDEENVYFDYNHPLAGKSLKFEITLLEAA